MNVKIFSAVGLVLVFTLTALGGSAAGPELDAGLEIRYDFINKLVDSSDHGYDYGYAPAIVYQDGVFQKQAEVGKAMAIPGWTCNAERMARTDNAIYTHPMPVDRGSEVTDEIASGPRSAIYDIAENRLHVQKAVRALTMGNL